MKLHFDKEWLINAIKNEPDDICISAGVAHIETYPTLWKIDSKGKIREWKMQIADGSYRSISGLVDGKKVESEWKLTGPKNVGKVNATTPYEQAHLEVQALYKKQIEQDGYVTDQKDLNKGPGYFKPMLAEKWEKHGHKLQYPFYSSPKLDGMRCVITKDGMFSRAGKPIVSAPHLHEIAVNSGIFNDNPDLVLDGELYNHDLRDNFDKLMSLVKKTKPKSADLEESADIVEFHCFDIGNVGKTFSDRYGHITNIIRGDYDLPMFKVVDAILVENKEQLDLAYGNYLEDGYEGQMIRDPKSLYENKRVKTLLKRKEFQDEEFEIIEILEGKGNWSGYAKHIICRDNDLGVEFKSGMRGDQETAKKLLEEKDQYVGGDITVRYQNRTPAGIPRFPVAVAFYKGKRND